MSDPVTLASIACLLLVWSVVGWYCWAAISPIEKSRAWQCALCAICGPLTWALTVYRLCRAARRAILRRFGVEGYSCCGGHSACDHRVPEPRERGHSNASGRQRGRGYPPDSLINHPTVS